MKSLLDTQTKLNGSYRKVINRIGSLLTNAANAGQASVAVEELIKIIHDD